MPDGCCCCFWQMIPTGKEKRMRLKLNKLTLENFKGIKNSEIKFDSKTTIQGQNGAGKTTIADAFYWLFADCNTLLLKNPPITPIGEEECISSVEAEILIDEKPCTA